MTEYPAKAAPDSRTGEGASQVDTNLSVFDADIEYQQVELIYRQAPVAILAAYLLSLLLVSGLWEIASHTSLLLWVAAQSAQAAARLFIVTAYRNASPSARQHPRWMLLFFISTLIAGVVWGCLGLMFSFSWPVQYQTMTLMSLAGVLAGAVSSYAVNMAVYAAFLVPVILIPAQSMLVYNDSFQGYVGLMLILFAAALLMIARNYNRHAVQVLHLLKINDTLLEDTRKSNSRLEAEIAERRLVEKDLRADQRLFTNGPVVMFRWSTRKGWPIEYVSEAVDMFGYRAEELMREGVSYKGMIHPSDLKRVEDAEFFSWRDGLQSVTTDYRLVGADGKISWVFDYTIPLYDEQGEITHYFGYILDITDRKNAEFELTREKERALITLHSIADAVITTDVNGQIDYMNASAVAMTGWDSLIARGMPITRVFRLQRAKSGRQSQENAVLPDPINRCLLHGEAVESDGDDMILRNDGQLLPVRFSVSPVLSTAGSTLGAVVVFHDLTRARTLERTISYQATHDALTGLWNRSEFELQIEEAVGVANRSGENHVVCILDIDQLKVINDTCAHETGDNLLRQVADMLTGGVRDSDAVARMGGDEFGILMRNCTIENAVTLAEELLSKLKSLRFSNHGRVFEVSGSVGLTQINPGCEGVTRIMSEADLACNAAKEKGGNAVHVFQMDDVEMQRRQEEMQWFSRLSAAIDENRLQLFCQQILPLNDLDARGVHFEVLVRMVDDLGEIITPDKFLPAAERYHLISGLDCWVISNAFAWYSRYMLGGNSLSCDTMSINLSGKSITDARVLDHIKRELQIYKIPPQVICFEITETAAISNLAAAAGFIAELRRLGCRFALDDFGSGLSSFAYLKNLPVDFLKIDGAFVRDMDTDEVDHAMVSAIQQLGRVMGIRTIAEFVRNDEILRMLQEIGVDFAQGYAIARPVPLDSIGREQKSAD